MTFNLKETISKINTGVIKIPTLVGMAILLIGLIGGVYLATQNQSLKSKAAVSTQPKNINVVNLNSTSASIYWQTDEATTGFIQAGIISQNKIVYRDDRDISSPQPHKLHFVSLTNLQPNTSYSYQIYSGPETYPTSGQLDFKTTSEVPNLDWPPLVGTIIDINNQAIDEAIIILNLPEAQKLATIAKAGGNFILPLSDIKTADLTSSLAIDKIYSAKLEILGTDKTAQATVSLPPQTVGLAPITLGNIVDLTQTTPQIASPSAALNKYDLNSDGIVNFADLSIVLQNFGPVAEAKNPKADLNNDSVIDQKDVTLLNTYLK